MSIESTIAEAVRLVVREELAAARQSPSPPTSETVGHPLTVRVATAAKLLDLTPETVREWCNEGKLKATRCPGGREWLIPWAELQRLADGAGQRGEEDEAQERATAQGDRVIARLRAGGR